MDNREWYQADNVANLFLSTLNKRDTRSLRISCTLKEDIQPELLQTALEEAILLRPQFHVRIHSGFFWPYIEESSSSPKVSKEFRRVCPLLYNPKNHKELHFEVSYYQKRINLDVFHAISDGTGAIEFLNIILLNYLKQLHPSEFTETVIHSGASSSELFEDSFKHFFGEAKKAPAMLKKAYHPIGLKLSSNQLQFMEIHLPLQELLSRSRAMKVSLTSYLGAQLILAFMKDMPFSARKVPISISMPVNLRNYYPSDSIRNFFNNISITHKPTGEETLEELAKEYDRSFKESLAPENIKAHMNFYQNLQHNAAVRMVPLYLKKGGLRFVAKQEDKKVSAVVSNLGVMKVPAEMQKYIEYYSGFCSSENIFITLFSYQDRLVLGVTNPYVNTKVLKNFVRSLSFDGISVQLYATEVTP